MRVFDVQLPLDPSLATGLGITAQTTTPLGVQMHLCYRLR